jgi:hypothetical protein
VEANSTGGQGSLRAVASSDDDDRSLRRSKCPNLLLCLQNVTLLLRTLHQVAMEIGKHVIRMENYLPLLAFQYPIGRSDLGRQKQG